MNKRVFKGVCSYFLFKNINKIFQIERKWNVHSHLSHRGH